MAGFALQGSLSIELVVVVSDLWLVTVVTALQLGLGRGQDKRKNKACLIGWMMMVVLALGSLESDISDAEVSCTEHSSLGRTFKTTTTLLQY
ncbi:hypothetical protein ElyMa_003814800 [Elysia marginata]|uniref:G-protein coupled receptors family 3 profile domain-containing protein n=1 Tax=Elysia marginata TaxID=1093978 RepID=A0AAV4FFM0_9GAST|nr:hypothetical protein ElyMa_003814800 [Elysia marginata]